MHHATSFSPHVSLLPPFSALLLTIVSTLSKDNQVASYLLGRAFRAQSTDDSQQMTVMTVTVGRLGLAKATARLRLESVSRPARPRVHSEGSSLLKTRTRHKRRREREEEKM